MTHRKSLLSYFKSSFIVTTLGLLIAGTLGWMAPGRDPFAGAVTTIMLCLVLSLLEVSLSFDNALVNATVIRKMTPVWKHRFMTWGMLIAVFGMRLVFPVAIVGIVAWINPWEALVLAATDPARYAEIMRSAHVPVAGFGGSFLLMVAFKHFFDPEKETHWFHLFEAPLSKFGKIKFLETIVALLIIGAGSWQLHRMESIEAMHFLYAGIAGIVTHLALDMLSSFLEAGGHGEISSAAPKGGLALFLYLEVQDASFSFDGVVGAFAITQDLFIIAIGLGIGAMFVRSLTIIFVERETLNRYRYIETGAFYAIGVLAVVMLISAFQEVPEVIPGAVSAALIVMAFYHSVLHNRKNGHG